MPLIGRKHYNPFCPRPLLGLRQRATTKTILLTSILCICSLPWLLNESSKLLKERETKKCISDTTKQKAAHLSKDVKVISFKDTVRDRFTVKGAENDGEKFVQIDEKSLYKTECVKYHVLEDRFRLNICIYDPKKDLQLSYHLKNYGTWERENVAEMLKTFTKFQDMILVDLGSNLGIFTLPVAALGQEVIAVDAFLSNHQLLHQSLLQNNLSCYVSLLHNAVYSKPGQMRVHVNPSNIGGSSVREISAYHEKRIPSSHRVNSICLNDLAPLVQGKDVFLKMDLEGTEDAVLTCADVFFMAANVKVLMMEWVEYRYNQEASDRIKTFLASHRMVPTWGVNLDRVIDLEASHGWPDNVFWMKQ